MHVSNSRSLCWETEFTEDSSNPKAFHHLWEFQMFSMKLQHYFVCILIGIIVSTKRQTILCFLLRLRLNAVGNAMHVECVILELLILFISFQLFILWCTVEQFWPRSDKNRRGFEEHASNNRRARFTRHQNLRSHGEPEKIVWARS